VDLLDSFLEHYNSAVSTTDAFHEHVCKTNECTDTMQHEIQISSFILDTENSKEQTMYQESHMSYKKFLHSTFVYLIIIHFHTKGLQSNCY